MRSWKASTFYLRSFGCQMNDHDSERIVGMLQQMGMSRCDTPEEAAVLVYNTCSIREKADSRLAGHLGLVARLKREDPSLLVVVAGCLPQSRRDDMLNDYPFVDVLVGPQTLHELPTLLRDSAESNKPACAFQEATTRWSAELPRARVQGPCAWVQITAGCTNYCSYCIVPYVRGPEASRSAADVIGEVRELTESVVREVTFLGQNVNAYGKEPSFAGRESFADLLSMACEVDGIERVRFMTSHPKDVSAELIGVMAQQNQVCEHVHLPAQSGSDRVLQAMRRQYDRKSYVELVRRWRQAVPGLTLTTDLIVGFPGETESDFADTLSLVDECDFDGAFTFIYSPRRGTEAADIPDHVDPAEAVSRMERLVKAVQRRGREKNEALVGTSVEVLIERVSRHDAGEVMGRTRGHMPVNFRSDAPPGELVQVELVSATSTSFRGRQG
jgi:tRNA-2-methylthio-N6-dimethylallyladenosine synthase